MKTCLLYEVPMFTPFMYNDTIYYHVPAPPADDDYNCVDAHTGVYLWINESYLVISLA